MELCGVTVEVKTTYTVSPLDAISGPSQEEGSKPGSNISYGSEKLLPSHLLALRTFGELSFLHIIRGSLFDVVLF